MVAELVELPEEAVALAVAAAGASAFRSGVVLTSGNLAVVSGKAIALLIRVLLVCWSHVAAMWLLWERDGSVQARTLIRP
jgi:hypothetical protein